MSEAIVLGFGHKARRGKDTAINAIIEKYGTTYPIARVGFSDLLKVEVTQAANMAGGMLGLFTTLPKIAMQQTGRPLPIWVKYDPCPDMTDPLCPLGKQRSLLQWWGTDFRRHLDPFHWTKLMKTRLSTVDAKFILIGDMRFMNEVAYIKAAGGFTVRMDRTGFSDSPLITSNAATHVSECELDDCRYDYVIEAADGDVDEVKKCALWVFDDILSHLRGDAAMVPVKEELWHIATPEGTTEVPSKGVTYVEAS